MGKRKKTRLSTYNEVRNKRRQASIASQKKDDLNTELMDTVSQTLVKFSVPIGDANTDSTEEVDRDVFMPTSVPTSSNAASKCSSDLAVVESTPESDEIGTKKKPNVSVPGFPDKSCTPKSHASSNIPSLAKSGYNDSEKSENYYGLKSHMYDPTQFLESEEESDDNIAVAVLKKSDIGSLFEQKICEYCAALTWRGESPSFCCGKGKWQGVDTKEPPQDFTDVYNRSADLRKHFRIYNNSFALSSIGCDEVGFAGFAPILKICGKIYHRIGSLVPSSGKTPKFAQLYFYDPDNELQNRISLSGGKFNLNPKLVETLQDILHDVNPYIQQIKTAQNLRPNLQECAIRLTRQPGQDKTYCTPTSSEIAGVQPHTDGRMLEVVFEKNGDLKFVNELSGLYDPLHYVLMFPYGDEGFDLDKQLRHEQSEKKLTIGKFYRYRLQVRDPKRYFNLVLRCDRTTQQYAIDQFLKDENSKLRFLQSTECQNKFRVATFSALADATSEDVNEPGQRIILPASHQGSPRWYHNAYLDMMSIVRKLGKPDLFITFTCNPEWPEIQKSVFENERPQNRPDIIARVFHLKLLELVRLLTREQIFGRVVGYTVVKEDQKRGLPHAHLLLILHDEDKPRTATKVDRLIRAEIPDKCAEAELFELIRKFNIHGPCKRGDPCHSDENSCSKGFPKPYNNGATRFDGNYYPTYRRRDISHGGHMISEGTQRQVDNAFVVPYNASLTAAFNAHVNVECVHSVAAVKYLYKYICKGSDKTTFAIEPSGKKKNVINEISRRSIRYIRRSILENL